jgi:hypothetical protein
VSPVTPPRSVRELVAAEAVTADDGHELAGWLRRLCRTATRTLPATAAGVSVLSSSGEVAMMAASSPAAAAVEELQFTLGEGPCRESCSLGRPVLVPDVAAAVSRWTGYSPALLAHGVQAVFAFPLQVGAVRLGALDVYQERAGPLPDPVLGQALAFAEAAMTALLDSQQQSRDDGGVRADDGTLSGPLVLYQAQGMVHVQLGVGLGEALARLRAHAFAQDRSLTDVARDVIAHKLDLERDS